MDLHLKVQHLFDHLVGEYFIDSQTADTEQTKQ